MSNVQRFKYLPYNAGSTNVISEGTIKFSAPRDFNDPFDCDPTFDKVSGLAYMANNKALLAEADKRLGLSPAKRIQQRPVMLKRLERAINSDDFWRNAAQQVGICSLSRKALNLLMWAHYAASHTGFVVEFDIPLKAFLLPTEDPLEKSLAVLCPQVVTYERTRPKVNLSDEPDLNAERQWLTKSDDWIYEAEERVVDLRRGPGIHPYDRKTILKSVIAGVNMGNREFSELLRLTAMASEKLEREIPVYRTQRSKDEYRLFVAERPDLIK